jgi:hypothetical protein
MNTKILEVSDTGPLYVSYIPVKLILKQETQNFCKYLLQNVTLQPFISQKRSNTRSNFSTNHVIST